MEEEGENQLVPVTVRVFGPNTDAVIDRDRELNVSIRLSFFIPKRHVQELSEIACLSMYGTRCG